MNRIVILVFALALAMFSVQSCDSPNQETDTAKLIVESEIYNTLGFEWYATEREDYEPDAQYLTEISGAFNPDIHKFLLFISPCQSCYTFQDEIPHASKILAEANIPADNIEFFFMSRPGDKHPYDDVFQIETLPNIFLLNDTASADKAWSILEDARHNGSSDTPLEHFILEALKR